MKSLKELADLHGRTALITGGAGHLGQVFGETLAELGANIVLIDRRGEEANAAAERIAALYGVDAVGMEIDLAEQRLVQELPAEVVAQFGRLDILINNAGFVGTDRLSGWNEPFEGQTPETWRAAVEVNMTAPVFLTQAALPWLRAKKNGSVINIGSIYAFLGVDMRLYEGTVMGNAAAYAASKGGLVQMTRWLASVLAPEVRVNCVSPGGVWRGQPECFIERYIQRTPQGRMAREEDMKGVIAWLAGDLSSYVTGQHIAVDGGWSAW